MGTTFGGPIPGPGDEVDSSRFTEVWNRKRIGLATAPSVFGPWTRCDEPLISPRDCSHWDCTATTNPAVAIQPDGTTYMLYKSRSFADGPLKIGVAKAPRPDGPLNGFWTTRFLISRTRTSIWKIRTCGTRTENSAC
ncbi:MAG: hypothetical protein ACLURV_09765 [Gallintestinimicrobium sp.]